MTPKSNHWLRLSSLPLLVCLLALPQGIVHATPTQAATTVSITDCSSDAQLQTAINTATSGGTIVFGCNGTIELTKTLTIGTNLTLDDPEKQVSLNGPGNAQVFIVNPDVSFTLNGLNFGGGLASIAIGSLSSDGGCLLNNQGTVTINNSDLMACSATNNGGGLANNRGTMSISDSRITFSRAFTGNGGGLYNYDGTVTINNSSFINDVSAAGLGASDGGGLYNYDGTMTIVGSTINNNVASNGGGLENYSDGSVTISGSTLTNNTPNNCAGSINNGGGNSSSDGSCGF